MNEYYAATAYRSDRLPNQPASKERPWLRRFSCLRLPWGGTEDLAPADFLEEASPGKLRRVEIDKKNREEQLAAGTYVPAPYEHVDFHDRHDHERFRFALWSKRSHFWLYLLGGGRALFYLFTVVSILSFFSTMSITSQSWQQHTSEHISFYVVLTGTPLLCWALGALVVYKFPRLWVKPSRGPLWELNRRTGLVTLFDYDNNGAYKKHGTIGEITAPFHEFDAYLVSFPDRQGLMTHKLVLGHRYRDILIDFGALVSIGPAHQLPCALWDFIQNYMDTRNPLPDLPRYEEYRHLDPTTADYDRLYARPPRLWIDMGDELFKACVQDMLIRIDNITTLQRPNQMARHVEYVD